MNRSMRGVRLCTLMLATIAALSIPSDVCAEPPPPSFSRFLFTNGTGHDMAAIELKLYQSLPPARDTIDMNSPIVVRIPSLARGQQFLYSPTQATWGVALIELSEARVMTGGFGMRLDKPIQIVAKKAVFSGGAPRYAGFTSAGPTSTYQMGAEFAPATAYLRGKWRWGWNWPDNVFQAPPSNPLGDETENWPDVAMEEKSPYVAAETPLPEWVTQPQPCCVR
jgi:hypothetical protein